MTQSDRDQRVRFWPVVGIACCAALLLALGYAIFESGFSLRVLSDGLCISAIVLSLGAGVPFLMDAGRGFTMAGKMGPDKEKQSEVWQEERQKRERGMRITFALALAAFLIGLTSLLFSLL